MGSRPLRTLQGLTLPVHKSSCGMDNAIGLSHSCTATDQ